MKKIAVVMLVLLMVMSGCKTKVGTVKKVNQEGIEKKFENKESFVFYVGSSTCSACIAYKPILEEFAPTNKIDIYYVETDKLNQEKFDVFIEKYLKELKYTPTTYIVKEGVVVDYKVNLVEYRDLKKWLVEHGVLQ